MTPLEALLGALPGPPDWRYDFEALRALPDLGDWFSRLERTPQEPRWHGEGDAWIHTRRVCEALCGLEGFRALEGEARQALALAALLHDVGKGPCTRRSEDGAWVAPRHAAVGARMARGALWRDYGLSGASAATRLREAVCLLVRFHTRPLHLIEGEHAARDALKLAACGEIAPAFTLRSLCLLSEADALGREADDVEDLLTAVALARALALEEGCLDGPWPFPSGQTRRAALCGANVWKGQDLYDDSWGEVLLLCGLPGTGKDTWLKARQSQLPAVSLDALRAKLGMGPEDNQGPVVQAAKEQAREYLRRRQPFAWNATSLTPLTRDALVALFEGYGARVRIVYLETGWDENLRRNASRPARVPEDVIGRMLDRLEPPLPWEAREVEWVSV